MRTPIIPHFKIRNNFQKNKSINYSDFLTSDILKDICLRITGKEQFTVEFINKTNKGQLLLLEYQNSNSYILIPNPKVDGRNSYFQSFPTGLVKYHRDSSYDKGIYFYFLPFSGNNDTNYYRFQYRLLATAGIQFLNTTDYFQNEIIPFSTVEDIISGRELSRSKNKSNNPTYVTKNSDNKIEIFGKTYGANKKETTLFCLALSNLLVEPAKLYIICEQNLTKLPAPDLSAIESLGKIEVIPTNLTMERTLFEQSSKLRSPHFIYNLLKKLGPKKCAFCECDIPQLIQAAHIWPVASIKREHQLTLAEKLEHATSKDNGIWLCSNHHKLFDENLLIIESSGDIYFSEEIAESSLSYLTESTPNTVLEPSISNENVEYYISKRYS